MKAKKGAVSTRRKKGLVLSLLNMRYHEEDVYLVLEIKNKSGIDFKIDYLDVYCVNGNNRRKASYQRLKQEVLYKYQMPNIIVDKHSERFVYVCQNLYLEIMKDL
ncbi:DUF4138 domain-containing protein [Yeosuana marina]|uniref:DUF4138 domain-containing protein n=1 Tax=Yeosuana marina TaxID=1565536 RepID=UPI0030C82078